MGVNKIKNIFSKKSNSGSVLDQLYVKYQDYQKELYMSNDMLFALTYMASISTANLTRDKIFSSISGKKEYCPGKYFNLIKELAQHWHYDYANACELISTKVKHDRMRELLNRLSNAIAAGEPDSEFLTKEWRLFKTKRKDEFERDLDTTKEWSNAYTALLVSTSLVAIIILLSVILYNIGDPADTLYSTMFIIFFMAFFGVGLLFRCSPKDTKVHNLSVKSKEQTYIYKWTPLTLVIAALAVLLLTVLPAFTGSAADFFIDIKGVGMIVAGVTMIPVGIAAKRDIEKINKRDESYTTFIRSLGSIISGSGLTVPKALLKIDPKNLGELKDMSQELYKKLASGLDPALCWGRFVGETGSYLIYKFTSVFVDAVNFGGNAEVVGELVSSSNLELVLLRMKRERIAKGFSSLVIPLHVSMVGLLLFIGQILTIFSTIINSLFTQFEINGSELEGIPGGMGGMNMGIFGGVPLELLGQFVVIVTIILTIANLLAIVAVKGGPMYLAIYYGIFMFILSGILMIIVPPLVEMAFSFNGVLDSLAEGM
ncbi:MULTISPECIES: archaellar assembly protein FlaJ [Methanosarcina]|jgi:flagellar protein FlaJ|uniref:Flagellar assembly protein FlaJ n=5 Tax=Methanosarcina mazei TaxID=2209 RepID=A0A0F8IHG5_METMZ|nr:MULTISPECIES: archaellar assembly protein FlaJ [Methanosarcina]AKB39963.1 Flagella-related protein FlaJ [Methanosarcina mazei WWM610]AKB67527.1 Flagella-related protein FlaJ [Methanosarcina mazei LYC]AKB70876.1 Flagella-related protein FlaJ [Methanosarcina mazei C16]KKG05360.1 flagellar assembly protein FlaJ [Methanosarcina mazei]KKG05571.1 flagellar assembly protein FlaJ [Methanosarcina mazei]